MLQKKKTHSLWGTLIVNVKKSNIKTNIFCSHNRIRRMGGAERGKGMGESGRDEG